MMHKYHIFTLHGWMGNYNIWFPICPSIFPLLPELRVMRCQLEPLPAVNGDKLYISQEQISHLFFWFKTCDIHTRVESWQWFLFAPGSYALSIRDLDPNTGEGVKHYRIRNMDNGGYYITAKISFISLKELVQHHLRAYIHLPMTYLCPDWLAALCLNPVCIYCPTPCRRFRRLVHKAGEAVPVEGAAEALVAGRVGDSQRVPQAAAETGSGTVWRSLDGWVAPNESYQLSRKWMWGPISLAQGHRETKHYSHSVPVLFLKWTSLECGKSYHSTWYASLNSELSHGFSCYSTRSCVAMC